MSKERVTPDLKPGYLRPQLPSSAPSEGESWDRLLADVHDKIKPGLTHWQHPKFFAWFPAGVTYPSILGEIYSAAFNAPAFNWLCSPACTELETVVMDWMQEALGLPECFSSRGDGGGVIQGSASEAVIVAVVAARERYVRAILEKEGLLEREGETEEDMIKREDRSAEIRGQLVAMGSDQAHSATAKAAQVLGLRYRSVHAGLDTDFRMTGANVRAKIAELDARGLRPFYLTASIGTTGTCAVDDLEEITKIRRERPEIWIHIDAAYAGTALICPEYREQCQAQYLSEVDSFDMNMHKWMLVNFDASCMFVQKRADLVNALTITRSYLVNPASLSGEKVTDYRDWQLPLGRRFRSLKIWFVLRTYGIKGIQEIIRKHVQLGEFFESLCRSPRGKKAGIQVVTSAAFALTVIRFAKPRNATIQSQHADASLNPQTEMNGFGVNAGTAVEVNGNHEKAPSATAESNALTKEIAERINAKAEFLVTPAVVDGINCIRIVGANPNTSEESVKGVFEALVSTYDSVVAAS